MAGITRLRCRFVPGFYGKETDPNEGDRLILHLYGTYVRLRGKHDVIYAHLDRT